MPLLCNVTIRDAVALFKITTVHHFSIVNVINVPQFLHQDQKGKLFASRTEPDFQAPYRRKMASLDEFIGKTVGVLGGGQLGKMMSAAAHRLGLRVCVMDSSPDCPCAGFVDKLLVGSVGDPQQVLRFKEEGFVKSLENLNFQVFCGYSRNRTCQC